MRSKFRQPKDYDHRIVSASQKNAELFMNYSIKSLKNKISHELRPSIDNDSQKNDYYDSNCQSERDLINDRKIAEILSVLNNEINELSLIIKNY